MDQYKQSGTPITPKVRSEEEKVIDHLESNVKDLQSVVLNNNKIIDKLQRDVRKLKDQISELAGRIPRG